MQFFFCWYLNIHKVFKAVGLGEEDSKLQSDAFSTLLQAVGASESLSPHTRLVSVSRNVMESSLKQHYAIKFSSKLNKSLVGTHKLIMQACRDSAIKYSQVSRWLKVFKGRGGRRTGRPSTSTTDNNLACVRDLLNSDRQFSVQMIAESLNIPKTIIYELLIDKLDMRKMCAKLVPKLLVDDQKNHRVTVATEFFKRVEIKPHFLDNVVTGDETWCFKHNTERSRTS
ncbi:hypothetical protein J437_LFUL012197 [Ladona fulva]|uniref:Mos1 transposase HTH domain-containing protein n=1 Tax=Ladona fulva TaxID=123851 RepID=A0A8K0KNI2_LADFU|nr:hypothetical protein J437_LFUL012197 [Ladona fulva]